MFKKKIKNSIIMGIIFFCIFFLIDLFIGIKSGKSSPSLENSPLTLKEAIQNIPNYLFFSFLFGFLTFHLTNGNKGKSDKDINT